MNALSRIHRSLRTGGFLLDVHPQPVNSGLEVWQGERITRLGEVDQRLDNQEIEEARTSLGSLEQRGMFATRDRRFFEMLERHPTVESWVDRWAEDGYRLVVDREILDSARDLLAVGGGDLVIREPVRATLLTRLAGVERDAQPPVAT